jgi:hypothetical protein
MALPRTYDAIFDRYRGEMPVAILRALARGESNFQPGLVHESGSKARGLLQVTTVVLDSYNKEHPGATVTADQLLDAEVNVRVACWHLLRLVAAYSTSGMPDLTPNWSSPRWVLLFVLGWNAGHSRASGVQYMVAWLHASKPRELPGPLWFPEMFLPDKDPVVAAGAMATADQVIEYAAEAKAASTLRPPTGPKKLAWCKKVLGWYGVELGSPPSPTDITPTGRVSGGIAWVLLLLAFELSRRNKRR